MRQNFTGSDNVNQQAFDINFWRSFKFWSFSHSLKLLLLNQNKPILKSMYTLLHPSNKQLRQTVIPTFPSQCWTSSSQHTMQQQQVYLTKPFRGVQETNKINRMEQNTLLENHQHSVNHQSHPNCAHFSPQLSF